MFPLFITSAKQLKPAGPPIPHATAEEVGAQGGGVASPATVALGLSLLAPGRGSFRVISLHTSHPAIGTMPSSFPGKSPARAGGGCHCLPVTVAGKCPGGCSAQGVDKAMLQCCLLVETKAGWGVAQGTFTPLIPVTLPLSQLWGPTCLSRTKERGGALGMALEHRAMTSAPCPHHPGNSESGGARPNPNRLPLLHPYLPHWLQAAPLPTWSQDPSVLQAALPPCLAYSGAPGRMDGESPRSWGLRVQERTAA